VRRRRDVDQRRVASTDVTASKSFMQLGVTLLIVIGSLNILPQGEDSSFKKIVDFFLVRALL
jgi:hypothetical protein